MGETTLALGMGGGGGEEMDALTQAKVALNLFQLLRLFFCRWIRMAFGFLLGIIAGERSGEEVA